MARHGILDAPVSAALAAVPPSQLESARLAGAGTLAQLRDVVLKEHAIPRVQVSLSGYWAYGRTEDAFQAEKREPIGQVFPPA